MNSSTSILSTAVVAAVLGSASLAVQAQAGTFGASGADLPASTHQPEMLNAPGSPQEPPGALAPDGPSSDAQGMGMQGSDSAAGWGADAAGSPGYGGGTTGYGTGASSSGAAMGSDTAGMGASRSSMGATGMGTDAAGVAGGMTGQSWLPYTTNGYVGGSLGMADFGDVCLGCDDPDWSGKIYTGGMINPWSGVEASWIWFGEGDRAGGGDVSAHGLNLSYILSFPVSQGFNVFGRLGGTYGWTDVSGGAPGAPGGDDNGFGLAYGVGASMDLAPNWAVRLEWERHRLKFAGNREGVDLATIGVSYKF